MANYPVPADPAYNAAIAQLENLNKVQADTVVNPVIQQLINNTHYNYQKAPHSGTTTGTGSAYVVNIPNISPTLTKKNVMVVTFHVANLAGATLQVNGYTAMPLKSVDGSPLKAGAIGAGATVIVTYDGSSSFFLMGGKPAPILTGNAAVTDVLSGKTFYGTDPDTKLTGILTTDALSKQISGSITGVGDQVIAGFGFFPRAIHIVSTNANTAYNYYVDHYTANTTDGEVEYDSWVRSDNQWTLSQCALTLSNGSVTFTPPSATDTYTYTYIIEGDAPVVLSGNATPADVRAGLGFYKDDPNNKLVGTMSASATTKFIRLITTVSFQSSSLIPGSSYLDYKYTVILNNIGFTPCIISADGAFGQIAIVLSHFPVGVPVIGDVSQGYNNGARFATYYQKEGYLVIGCNNGSNWNSGRSVICNVWGQ